MSFTKLHREILHSTIWREPDHVRLVWITMLAMRDENHEVMASVPGLADATRVSLEKCEDALKRLSSPDKYSRNKAYDGRRIAECTGGWMLLNGEAYRARRSKEERKEYKREWAKEKRRQASTVAGTNVDNVDPVEKSRVEYSREEKNKKSRTKISFSTQGEFLNLEDFLKEKWGAAYPALNIDTELSKAASWLLANPKNKKNNYERFLVNWFSRAQDRAPKVEKKITRRDAPK